MEYSKQYYRELAEKVETGEYFEEARDWYIKKYIEYFIERTYSVLFILVICALFFFTFEYYSGILPIKKSLPVRVGISNAAYFSTKITYLGNEKKDFDVNDILIKYFSKRFVDSIESYDFRNNFQKLRVNKNMIETLGSDEILAYYLDKISIRNRDSILLKFRKNIIREITIADTIEIAELPDAKSTEVFVEDKKKYDSIKKMEEEKQIKKYQVTINFDANEIDKDGTQVKSTWQSKIILSFQTVLYNFEAKEFSPFNFKVLSYESKKIQ